MALNDIMGGFIPSLNSTLGFNYNFSYPTRYVGPSLALNGSTVNPSYFKGSLSDPNFGRSSFNSLNFENGIGNGVGAGVGNNVYSQKNPSKFLGATGDQWGKGIGIAADIGQSLISAIAGPKMGSNGPNAGLTQGLDQAYDLASNAMMMVNPLVGGIMKGAGLVGNIINAAGGGTDGMTTIDGILNSAPMTIATLGLNGFLGSKADTMAKDSEAFDQAGSSYGGTGDLVNDALNKASKKYGFLSMGSRDKANALIRKAEAQQGIMSDIVSSAKNNFAIQSYMTNINNNRRANKLQGGYNQAAIRIGRQGLKIKRIVSAYNMLMKLQKGGTIKDPFNDYLSSLPLNLQDTTNYRMKDYWEYNGRPKNFDEAIQKGMFTQEQDGWHAYSVQENPATGEIEFMKSPNHPTIQQEIEWYNSDDGAGFRSNYELVKSTPYWKYVKRKEIIPHSKENALSQKVKDYYNGYDLSNVVIINDPSPRTEGNIIYSPSDEYTVHELWHLLSQNKPNEALKEFYDQLDDAKLQKFGADLEFVKRTGDPGEFYQPSELEARLKAAKFMSQGSVYNKEFFRNLRNNENKYGDNMRDLLRMFNDDYLEKLFNTLPKFQKGGSFNVIPEGALHARKHNMDVEGITTKGIPVISKGEGGELEQQAEIEREEIIFRLEVTKKLEELLKKYSDDENSQKEKDEVAIEAGKLLVKEILYNTKDNTNNLI